MNYWATARLKPGITLARAQAELKVVQAAIDKQIEGNFDVHASMVPLMESMIGKSRQGLLLVMAAVARCCWCCGESGEPIAGAVAGRSRDAAIRTALGAGQWRLIRQSMVESVVLAVTGGVLGILLACGA